MSDIKYFYVDVSVRAQMKQCLILNVTNSLNSDLDKACPTWLFGRYIYISLIRENDDPGDFSLYEVRVYMGKYWYLNTVKYLI